MEGDFSTCIGYLWKYELGEVDDPSELISLFMQTKSNYVTRLKAVQEEIPEEDEGPSEDLFGFENIDENLDQIKDTMTNKAGGIKNRLAMPTLFQKGRVDRCQSQFV